MRIFLAFASDLCMFLGPRTISSRHDAFKLKQKTMIQIRKEKAMLTSCGLDKMRKLQAQILDHLEYIEDCSQTMKQLCLEYETEHQKLSRELKNAEMNHRDKIESLQKEIAQAELYQGKIYKVSIHLNLVFMLSYLICIKMQEFSQKAEKVSETHRIRRRESQAKISEKRNLLRLILQKLDQITS
jgi:hypothetical protein